jgi:hypothetical protein
MLAKVCSAAVNGIEAYPVEVEVNAGFGDTQIVMVVGVSPTGPEWQFHHCIFRSCPSANLELRVPIARAPERVD